MAIDTRNFSSVCMIVSTPETPGAILAGRRKGIRLWRAMMLLGLCLPAACASRAAPASVRAAAVVAVATDTLAPGLIHQRYTGTEPAIESHVVTVDLGRPELHIEAGPAGAGITGRERTSAIARRHTRPADSVLVAVNADFFDLETGEVENNQVAGGDIVRATPLTDSSHDTFDNIHAQFALTVDRRPLIERFRFAGEILLEDGARMRIDAVNTETDSSAVVLYTRDHESPAPFVAAGAHLGLDVLPSRGDTALYVVAAEAGGERAATLPGVAVLAASGAAAVELRRTTSPGDTLRMLLGFQPDHGPIRMLVGGWPRIVRDGASVAAQADSVEGTFASFSKQRHPRTAVGFSRDSTLLYLVTVDGRQDSSAGMTLEELAEFLIEIGAYHAVNLDGGGSTTLVIRDEVVNSPSDAEGERAVGNAILVQRRSGDEK